MPLLGNYTFTEKKDKCFVQIPLKGVAPNKVDIFVTNSKLKVNYSPYIVDIVLYGAIDSLKHKATVKEGALHLTLFKQNTASALWGTLEADPEDKEKLAEVRTQALAAHDELQKELADKRRDRKVDDERHSTRKQMALDEAERTRLDNIKLEEKTTAEEAVYSTFAELKAQQDQQEAQKKQKSMASSSSSSSSSSASASKQPPAGSTKSHTYNNSSTNERNKDNNKSNKDTNTSSSISSSSASKAIFNDADVGSFPTWCFTATSSTRSTTAMHWYGPLSSSKPFYR